MHFDWIHKTPLARADMQRWIFFAALLFLFAGASASFAAADRHPVRVMTTDAAERTAVTNLGLAIETVDLRDGSIIVRVDDKTARRIQTLGFEILPFAQAVFPSYMSDYHNELELLTQLLSLVETYPNIIEAFSIGTTYEGREMLTYRISDNPQEFEADEPAFLIASMYHAREHVTVEVALDFITHMLEGYGQDDYITWLIDNREIYVIPRMNADGHTWDIDNNMAWWRKNRAPNQNIYCPGVDLNRNFEVGFGGEGASSDQCSEVYHGPSAFSEIETQSLRDFISEHPNLTMVTNLHTYGGMILYPWGHTYDAIPTQDLLIHSRIAGEMARTTGYVPMQTSDLYICSGAAVDWEYSIAGLAAFTFEMTGSPGSGTFYPADSILPGLFNKMRPTLKTAAGISGDPTMILSTELWRLSAMANQGTVTVSWSPIVEGDGGGWNVLRATSSDGDFEKINDGLINFGQSDYEYIDAFQNRESFWYMVEYQGATTTKTFGPINVEVEFPDADVDDDVNDDLDDDIDDDVNDDANDDIDDDSFDDDWMNDDASDDDLANSDDDDDETSNSCGC